MKRLLLVIAALIVSVDIWACTTAVVSAGASADGRPMLWKQRDAPDPYNVIAHIKGGKYAFTALFPTKDSLHTRAYAGINEVGFGIMNNLSYNLAPDSLVGSTRAGALMAKALSECRTLEDFEALLRSPSKPLHQSSNFGVIDALGGAAYFEVSDTSFVRYDVPEGGILYRTNYSLSGDEGRGRGFERYATMGRLTAKVKRYCPAFFFKTGRSDYVPRPTTTASIVIEGVPQGGNELSGMLWCATGYTPCSYAIPVWVAAGDEIAEPLLGEANLLSVSLKERVHSHPDHPKMMDVKQLRKIRRAVIRAERREARAARTLLRRGAPGIDAIRSYNTAAERRFEQFKNKLSQ